MSGWDTHCLILRMIQRRLIIITCRMLRVPSTIFAFVLSFVVIFAIWSNLHIHKRGENIVDFIKKTHSVAYFRPIKRDNAIEENKNHQNFGVCPIYQLQSKYMGMVPENDSMVACKRLTPVPQSCDVAKEIFDLHGPPTPANCLSEDTFNFCHLQRMKSNAWMVLCDSAFTEVCTTSGLLLGLPSHDTGELVWESYHSAAALSDALTSLVQGRGSSHSHPPPHHGFAFITCNRKKNSTSQINENTTYYNDEYYQDIEDRTVEQLLILPPFLEMQTKSEFHVPRSFHDLNLNVILVDSVSHQHLFRSLPKTISTLEKMSRSPEADVFSFDLFQSIKSRTFETLQTIMSGYINVTESSFGRYEIPSKPLNLAPIYKLLQNRGYRTLWLEDLCYLWEWGISKDLNFLQYGSSPEDTWKRMWLALKENGVIDIGATISMCRILEANKVKDHFHGPDAVCFNGKHQHEYVLEYLQLYQGEMATKAQPFFTMTSTNVAHESTGKRVQTLDEALSSYVSFASSLKNTVTIVFSDHGNSYGKFFRESKEAMIELYHPFMFFIIPDSAGAFLGKDLMEGLARNTKRLVTSLDIHYTLLHIANVNSNGRSKAPGQQFTVSEKGLFHPVDTHRGCSSVPRLQPSVCICQTPSVQLKSTSFGSLFGYLAVGALNDEIQFQYQRAIDSSTPISAFGNCEPLLIKELTDIKEITGQNDQRAFQMNIHVQQSQIFFVSISAKSDKNGKQVAVLESYSRVTSYGMYSNCSDTSVELALCVCNMSVTINSNNSLVNVRKSQSQHDIADKNHKIIPSSNQNSFHRLNLNLMTVLPFFNYSMTPFKHTPCFYILSVIHKDGEALFGINACQHVHTLSMKVKSESKFLYFHKQGDTVVLPGGIVLCSLVVSKYGERWKDDAHTDFYLTKY